MAKRSRPRINPLYEAHDIVRWSPSTVEPVGYDGAMYFDSGANTATGAAGMRLYANGRWNDMGSGFQSAWAPIVSDGSTSATTDTNRSWYVVHGGLCTVYIGLRVTNTTGMGATNVLRFSLPFTMKSPATTTSTSYATGVLGYCTNVTPGFAGTDDITIRVQHGNSYATVLQNDWPTTGTNLRVQDMGAPGVVTSEFQFTITYPYTL